MRLLAIILVLLLAGLAAPLFIVPSNAEYALPIVWSNKKQYDPSEMAYLYGYGFNPSTQVTVTIVRPDLVEDVVQTSTDQFGYFVCQYLLQGMHGIYTVTATDGVNVATTTFDNWLNLNAYWNSGDCLYLYAEASGLTTSKSYYVKYFDPAGVEKRKSPTYTGVHSFRDNLTILPTFSNILGYWTVKLYENGALKKTKQVYIGKMVWTTDSTYTNVKTSFAQGETVYFKTIGLQTSKYYRFKLEMPNGTRFFVGSWTTGVTQMTGSYVLLSTAPVGSWKVHVRQADDASGTCEVHYVDCCFQVTTAPTPLKYYLTVRTSPTGIGTIPGQGWYNASTIVNLTAPEAFPGSTGTRYRFDYWDVDSVPNVTGIREISICMNANHTATAHYVTQYYLNLTTSPLGVTTPAGIGWYDASTNAPIFAPEFVSIITDVSRYRFNGWTTGDMPEIADPSAISTTVLMDKAKTVTANYVVQYMVKFDHTGLDTSALGTVVTVDSSAKTYGDLPYSFWVDSGTVVTYSYSSIVSSSTSGKRFSLVDVSGPASPITVTSAVTVTGNYKTQYLVSFTQTGSAVAPTVTYTADVDPTETVPFSVWVKAGSQITYTYQDIVSGSSGVRYVLTSVSPASPQTVSGPLTIVGNYKTQYCLTVNSPYGTTTGAGWYDTGSTAYAGLNTSIVDQGNGTRRIFIYWNGDASGTNYAQSDPITMSGPKTANANWKTQYLLTVRTNGLGLVITQVYDGSTVLGTATDAAPFTGWFDQGTVIQLDIDPQIVNLEEWIQYVFTQWTGDASGSSRPVSVTLNAPKDITANYKTQYGVSFTHTGLDSSASGTVVTVNGDPKTYDDLPFIDLFVDLGTVVTYSYSNVSSTTAGKRFILTGVTGPTSPITVTSSVHIVGNYKTQYEITFAYSGVNPDFSGAIFNVDGTDYSTAKSFWWDSGSSHSFAFKSPLVVGANVKRYVWTSTTGLSTSQSGSITVSTSGSVTGNYKTQYLLTVQTNPSGLSPQPTRNPAGEAGPTNGWWYDAATSVSLNAQTVTGYTFSNWIVDGASQGSGVNPIAVSMNALHVATANYTAIALPPSVSINPLLKTILVNESVTFTSTVGGGTAPYTYQWYLDGSPVSGATSSSWTFTPSASGIYYVYLKVTDSASNTVQSATAKVTVSTQHPVGGYTVSLPRMSPASMLAVYGMIIVLFAVALSMPKRKRK
ncbi:PKD domain-containing protein [Candidatus Bathyarchaeota archaeon]|nr:PKD domain-containing protein [Candidatus Bathyarchaeota archaeon]